MLSVCSVQGVYSRPIGSRVVPFYSVYLGFRVQGLGFRVQGQVSNLVCSESDRNAVGVFSRTKALGVEIAHHGLRTLLGHILTVLSCGNVVNLVGVSRAAAADILQGVESSKLVTRPGWAVSECSRRAYHGQDAGVDPVKFVKAVTVPHSKAEGFSIDNAVRIL